MRFANTVPSACNINKATGATSADTFAAIIDP